MVTEAFRSQTFIVSEDMTLGEFFAAELRALGPREGPGEETTTLPRQPRSVERQFSEEELRHKLQRTEAERAKGLIETGAAIREEAKARGVPVHELIEERLRGQREVPENVGRLGRVNPKGD